MKHVLLVLLLVWSAGACLAQPKEGLSQTPDTAAPRIPRSNAMITKAWRYHAGDNPAWARPDFDASAWDTLDLHQLPRMLARAAQPGVCWLRLRFRLPDSLRQRTLVLQLFRLGTADLYLNGRLLTDSAHRPRTRGFLRAPGLLEVPANGPAE